MMNTTSQVHNEQPTLKSWLVCMLLLLAPALAQGQASNHDLINIEGQWLFNQDLSDITDRKVEVALRAMGQKVKRRLFDRRRDRYRGGPEEQELYDRLSYDQQLSVRLQDDAYQFTYDDDFTRLVYLDNRQRAVNLSGLDELEDFSFAHRENDNLLVEGRARDGGFSNETYSLSNDGMLLTVDLYIHPASFTTAIEIQRVYERSISAE